MERKEFIKKTFTLCGLSLIPVGLAESCSKPGSTRANVNFTLDLTNTANASLNSPGGSLVVNGAIIINSGSSVFHAFSCYCTHQGCTVGFSAGAGEIVCPCHGSIYNATSGAVLSGPAPSALPTYTVTQAGNILTVKS